MFEQLTVAIDFHSMGEVLNSQWLPSTVCLVTNILQNIFYCVQLRKETHTGYVSKWQNFWVNFPFKDLSFIHFISALYSITLDCYSNILSSVSLDNLITNDSAHSLLFSKVFRFVYSNLYVCSTSLHFTEEILLYTWRTLKRHCFCLIRCI